MRFAQSFVPNVLMCALAAAVLAACSAPQSQASAQQESQAAPADAPVDPAEVPPPLPDDVRSSAADALQGKRAAGQEGEPLLAYRVVGTEPFWGIRVEGDALHFTTMEDQVGKHLTGTHTLRDDGIRYVGSDAGTAFELDLEREQCSDGMSDTVYAFKASFRYGTTDYSGCAEQAMAKK
jgi:uncharacterized membrane protein